MKILDVGAGPFKYSGSISIDFNPKVNPDVQHNLDIYPWPLKDSEFDVIYSSNCLEHLENPKRALEEMWRIAKPGAEMIIKVPHFSSRIAYGDVEHKRFFGICIFNNFSKKYDVLRLNKAYFEVDKIRLKWSPPFKEGFVTETTEKCSFLIKVFDEIFTFLANINVDICERIWCYWVGGFGEIEFKVRVVKDDSFVNSQ